MKHTAGQWTADNTGFGTMQIWTKAKDGNINPDDLHLIAIVKSVEDKNGVNQLQANAMLIAAAPDLLKALQNMVNISYDTARPTKEEKNFNLDKAIAAIKAATGIDN